MYAERLFLEMAIVKYFCNDCGSVTNFTANSLDTQAVGMQAVNTHGPAKILTGWVMHDTAFNRWMKR